MSGDDRARRIVAAARALAGTPFRLHGRGDDGVDCVGLALLALQRAGHGASAPDSYGLRMGNAARVEAWLRAAGLAPVADARPGDIALVRPGPLQLHLMIHVPGGFVHAHAGLRRVVAMPGQSPWPVIGHWRAE